jgi:hypothetical protein
VWSVNVFVTGLLKVLTRNAAGISVKALVLVLEGKLMTAQQYYTFLATYMK